MPIPRYLGFVLLLAVALATGCAARSKPRSASAASDPLPAAPAHSEDFSPEAVERRVEALAHYGTAIIHDMNDDPERAADELCQAATNDLENEPLILEVSRRLMQLKKNEQAAELLAKATAKSGASGALFARLGLIYAVLGKNDEAIAANRTAIKKMPGLLAGYQNLARIYLQNAQHAEGMKVLDQAFRQPETDAAFLVELAELYTAYARSASAVAEAAKPKALECLDRAAKLNPGNPIVIQTLADGFALLGETEKATEFYLKLLERFPNLPGMREKLADIYLRRKDNPKAAEQLQAIIRNNPTNPQAYYFLGSIAFEDKKMQEAADHFRKALLLRPDFEPAAYDLALAQINLNQPKEALATLAEARKRFKQTFVGEFFTALAFSRMKDYSNALQHMVAAEVVARATDTNRLTHMFYFQLGAAYERNKQYEEAENSFRKCLALAPDSPETLNYMGYMWAERGVNLAEARSMLEKAVRLDPTNAAYLDSMAWVLFKQGEPQEALTWLLKALEHIDEPDPTLYDHLGDIYLALKEPDKAADAWKKSLAIEASPEIEKKLRSVSPGPTSTSSRAPP